jgi:hypothetical protein
MDMTKLPYKHTCQRCETEFRSKGPNNKYCSVECKKQTYFENSKLYTCKVCDSKFQGSKGNYNIFCSKKCYGSRMNTHPKEFGMAERSAKMRESRVSEVAWKKGIETRKANGNIIDWNVAEWKQYWRRCNDLTRKIRVKLLGDWDGIDYIDGEDIRENLALPYTHGDYPTLDHVIPRSEGFRQGLSPYEITTPENLKWTKRRNNSKKYNKISG